MDWKQLPILDKDLVTYLRTKFPPVDYKDTATSEELARLLAVHSGCLEVIWAIESVINMQKKAR